MSVFQSLIGGMKSRELIDPTETANALAPDDATAEGPLMLAPLQLVRTQRDIENAIRHLEDLVAEGTSQADVDDLGRRLLDSSRQLSAQLRLGFDALRTAQAVSQATITEKSVIVEFIQDRLATRKHYGNPFSLVLFRVDDASDNSDALAILKRLIRVTDRAYLMSENEIVVVLPETSLEGGRVFARRCVLDTIEELGARTYAGVTDAMDQDDVASLIQRADEALYHARQDDYCFTYSHNGESVLECGERPAE